MGMVCNRMLSQHDLNAVITELGMIYVQRSDVEGITLNLCIDLFRSMTLYTMISCKLKLLSIGNYQN